MESLLIITGTGFNNEEMRPIYIRIEKPHLISVDALRVRLNNHIETQESVNPYKKIVKSLLDLFSHDYGYHSLDSMVNKYNSPELTLNQEATKYIRKIHGNESIKINLTVVYHTINCTE